MNEDERMNAWLDMGILSDSYICSTEFEETPEFAAKLVSELKARGWWKIEGTWVDTTIALELTKSLSVLMKYIVSGAQARHCNGSQLYLIKAMSEAMGAAMGEMANKSANSIVPHDDNLNLMELVNTLSKLSFEKGLAISTPDHYQVSAAQTDSNLAKEIK